MAMWLLQQHIIMCGCSGAWNLSYYHLLTQAVMPILDWGTNQTVDLFKSFNPAWSFKVFYIKLITDNKDFSYGSEIGWDGAQYHEAGRYSMMTSSNGNIFRVTGHLCREYSPHKSQWRGVLMFSLICVWINGQVNNREAGDLRRHRVHYDVTIMKNGYAMRIFVRFTEVKHGPGLRDDDSY